MIEQLIARLGKALDEASLPYMIIGGQAVLVHGRLRVTEDVDITLGVDTSASKRVLELAAKLDLDPIPPDPQEFAEQTFVLPVRHRIERMRVDFVFSFTPYEQQAITHAVERDVGGYTVKFASAEDLILHKLFAARPRDIEDIRGVMARKGTQLDKKYLRKWAKEFSQVEDKQNFLHELDNLLKE